MCFCIDVIKYVMANTLTIELKDKKARRILKSLEEIDLIKLFMKVK